MNNQHADSEREWSRHEPATKHDLQKMKEQIMSQLTDWADKEQADLTSIAATVNTIVTGIAALNTLITNLQNSPGKLSASDQAALDAIKASSDALVTQTSAINVAPPGTTSPAIAPIVALTVSLSAAPGPASVTLAGITSTAPTSSITVTASASDGGSVISAPVVTYTSPTATGTLSFTPVAVGTSTVTVSVGDGVGTASQSFVVTVTA